MTDNTSWISVVCPAPSAAHAERARARQLTLTKPAGALGQLENLAITLAGQQSTDQPSAARAPILIFAGDHGIIAQGVSAFPGDVTVQMLHNFSAGGAAISVLARELGVPLTVIDAGTLAVAAVVGVITDKPRQGSRDFSREPALTPDELVYALACGQRAVATAVTAGVDVLILGEMGIGNTTSAAAIASALMARPPDDLVGRGTGIDAAARAHKVQVIRDALARHELAFAAQPIQHVLTAVGGLEIGALVGAIVASAQRGVPVLVDGFIVSVAALAAVQVNPSVRPWLLFAHRSSEQGHGLVLEQLGAVPLLDLGLRLGEASGAAVALPVLRLACALHNGMATFAEAQVAERVAP